MNDDLGTWISTYGYFAVAVGCLFEGETAVILGAFAAVSGYLQMPGIVIAAFVGGVIGDNIWFWLGRRLGRPFILRHSVWRRKARRAERLARRHGTVTILSIRFLYGLRSVTPFVLGAVRVHPLKFLLLEAISALAWALLVGWVAWPLAVATVNAVGTGGVEWYVIGAILGATALIWTGYFLYQRLRLRANGDTV
jgi:membrane protein DedA with SNARE-associated domain